MGRDGPGRLSVRTEGEPLGEVLARVGAAAGVAITSLSPGLLDGPAPATAGPGPVEQLVRELVRPHGVAVLYGAGGRRPTVIVVLPRGEGRAGGASTRPLAAAPRGALVDLGPSVDPQERHGRVLALGRDLDDPEAVALLEATARGESGLEPDDPARLLARSLLSTLPGRPDEEDEEQPGG